MKKPSRRDAGIGVAPVSAEVLATLKFDHATMSDIAQALAGGQVNATALTKVTSRASRPTPMSRPPTCASRRPACAR